MHKIESKIYDDELEKELEQAKETQLLETKDQVNELEIEIKVNKLIDEEFDHFKVDLLTDSKPNYDLREKRNLSMEKMENWELRIKSYGESCELDLKTGKIYYIKWWKRIEIRSSSKEILDISSEGFILNSSDLYKAFGKMNVINRAISIQKVNKKDFQFLRTLAGVALAVDWKIVISFEWLKKWFGNNISEEGILYMLNKAVL